MRSVDIGYGWSAFKMVGEERGIQGDELESTILWPPALYLSCTVPLYTFVWTSRPNL
jgi:hypothetical protein